MEHVKPTIGAYIYTVYWLDILQFKLCTFLINNIVDDILTRILSYLNIVFIKLFRLRFKYLKYLVYYGVVV